MKNVRKYLFTRIVCWAVIVSLPFSSLAQAQSVPALPATGSMVLTTPAYVPAMLKGIRIHQDNPFLFDFFVDNGQSGLTGELLRGESDRLINYFMASLTVPEEEMWVNLSPHESNRIIPHDFGLTQMGRDMLGQDYILKQLAASLMHPDGEVGKELWERLKKSDSYLVNRESFDGQDSETVPGGYAMDEILDAFNKVWIVPERVVVYENGDTAFVVESYLKVMLEQDYLAMNSVSAGASDLDIVGTADLRSVLRLEEQKGLEGHDQENPSISKIQSQVIREIIIPIIEKEVNTGENFAPLRQIFNSLILATWFKRNLKQSFLGQVYVDQKKISGIEIDDAQMKDKIYAKYIEAYKKGVFDYIKEEYDPLTQQIVPRKYFSGGITPEVSREYRQGDAQAAANSVVGDMAMVTMEIGGDRAMNSEAVKPILNLTDGQFVTKRMELTENNLKTIFYEKPFIVNPAGQVPLYVGRYRDLLRLKLVGFDELTTLNNRDKFYIVDGNKHKVLLDEGQTIFGRESISNNFPGIGINRMISARHFKIELHGDAVTVTSLSATNKTDVTYFEKSLIHHVGEHVMESNVTISTDPGIRPVRLALAPLLGKQHPPVILHIFTGTNFPQKHPLYSQIDNQNPDRYYLIDEDEGLVEIVEGELLTLGRHSDHLHGLKKLSAPHISGTHLKIEREGHEVKITDLNSRNKTAISYGVLIDREVVTANQKIIEAFIKGKKYRKTPLLESFEKGVKRGSFFMTYNAVTGVVDQLGKDEIDDFKFASVKMDIKADGTLEPKSELLGRLPLALQTAIKFYNESDHAMTGEDNSVVLGLQTQGLPGAVENQRNPDGTPVGGIDFKAENINIETTGNGTVPLDYSNFALPENMDATDYKTFIPTIINISPVYNIPLLLGIKDQPQELSAHLVSS